MNIADCIKKIANQEANIIVAKVTAVDKEARTVDVEPLDESAPVLGVNLQANQEAKVGIVQYPRIDSYVVVALFKGNNAGAVMLTEDIECIEVVISSDTTRLSINEEGIIANVGENVEANINKDTIDIKVGDNTKVELTKDGIVFNGGDLGGLVKIGELENNLDQIKDYVETMKTAISSGFDAIGAALNANGTSGKTAFESSMSSATINYTSMENEKVKQ